MCLLRNSWHSLHPCQATGLPSELRDVQLVSPSPSGALQLVAKAGTEGGSVLELWTRQRLAHELHVPKALHGARCRRLVSCLQLARCMESGAPAKGRMLCVRALLVANTAAVQRAAHQHCHTHV